MGPFIKIKFLDKVINGKDGINLFQFRVTTQQPRGLEGNAEPIKMTKKYSDFLSLERLVRQQLYKQIEMFGEGSVMYQSPMPKPDVNRSYRGDSLSDQAYFPTLDQSTNTD